MWQEIVLGFVSWLELFLLLKDVIVLVYSWCRSVYS